MFSRSSALKGILHPSAAVKAILLLSFMMVLVSVLATSVLLLDLRQRELAHAMGEIGSLNRVLAEQTTRTFEGVALVLRGTQERLSDETGSRLALDSFPVQLLLQARAAGLPQVKSMFVVDRDGYGVNSSRPDFVKRLAITKRAFFRHFADGARDELFISAPEKARVDGEWTFYVSTRLTDPSGQFRGVLVAAIRIEYFETLYDSISLDAVSGFMLLNNEGLLLAGKPHDDAHFGKVGITPATLAALRNGSDGMLISHETQGERNRFVAYRQVAKYPLMIGTAVEEDDALEPWRRVARPIVAGVVLVILFVLLTTFLMLRNLLRREALESDLKERDEQLRHMVQSVQDAFVTIDADGRLVLFNRAAERMFGIAASEVIGAGVNDWLARAFGGGRRSPLAPPRVTPSAFKLVVFVPRSHVAELRAALANELGLGRIGNYSECSYELDGQGSFYGNEAASPRVGERGCLEFCPETRLEMRCEPGAVKDLRRVIAAHHPYEEPAWDLYPLVEPPSASVVVGAGRLLELEQPMSLTEAVARLKTHLGVATLRVATCGMHAAGSPITRIAVCAGAGGGLFEQVQGADLYVTGELRHHAVLAKLRDGASVILSEHSHTERGYLPEFGRALERAAGGALEALISTEDADPLATV